MAGDRGAPPPRTSCRPARPAPSPRELGALPIAGRPAAAPLPPLAHSLTAEPCGQQRSPGERGPGRSWLCASLHPARAPLLRRGPPSLARLGAARQPPARARQLGRGGGRARGGAGSAVRGGAARCAGAGGAGRRCPGCCRRCCSAAAAAPGRGCCLQFGAAGGERGRVWGSGRRSLYAVGAPADDSVPRRSALRTHRPLPGSERRVLRRLPRARLPRRRALTHLALSPGSPRPVTHPSIARFGYPGYVIHPTPVGCVGRPRPHFHLGRGALMLFERSRCSRQQEEGIPSACIFLSC